MAFIYNGGGGSLPSTWTVGSDGAVTIAPTRTTTKPLTINLPAGADVAGQEYLEGQVAGVVQTALDAGGDLTLNTSAALEGTLYLGDTPTGGFWFLAAPDDVRVRDPVNNVNLFDVDPIGHKVGFFDHAGFSGGATQQALPAAAGLQDLQVALRAYGLLTSANPTVNALTPIGIITSGALPTVALVSGTGAQILTTRDAETLTPVTFNPGAATTATCTIALSPDNVTYSTLGIETEPAGTALDGTIHVIRVRVPAGWYLKLTVNAQATLGTTTYY